MKRHTCIECSKKRYSKFMKRVPILITEAKGSHLSRHWVCFDCIYFLRNRLSFQVRQLNKIIEALGQLE